MQSAVMDDIRKKSTPDLRKKETPRDTKALLLIEEVRADSCEQIAYITGNIVSPFHHKIVKKVALPLALIHSKHQDISVSESEDAKGFIKQNNLDSPYKKALELIKDFIPGIISIESDLDYDAEDDEQWVDILTTVTASGRETALADTALLRFWLEEDVSEETELIRLTYGFAS